MSIKQAFAFGYLIGALKGIIKLWDLQPELKKYLEQVIAKANDLNR